MVSCRTQTPIDGALLNPSSAIHVGAERMDEYLSDLQSSKVAVVANHTALVKNTHLVDTLTKCNIKIAKVFAPEHGFRGDLPPGEKFDSYTDRQTGIEVVSLYGKHAKPTQEDLIQVDVVVFDIQDVGARFYTYLTTLYYVMQSCAENKKKLIVLDRPNPNGHYVDGPVLDKELTSMVGALPIPIVHGCTLGEMAKMIKGEGWGGTENLDLKVVSCNNWTHQTSYSLPVPPSPNLHSDCAIALYPSLCWFEGTTVSVGRGTPFPFTCYGYPKKKHFDFSATPEDILGKVNNPPHEHEKCGFVDLRSSCQSKNQIDLNYLLEAYQELGDAMFDNPQFFDKLAGTRELRVQLQLNVNEETIRASWRMDLDDYLIKRKKYLLYP
jgi:uncharacterized protein YbbC (DUF1343 family)